MNDQQIVYNNGEFSRFISIDDCQTNNLVPTDSVVYIIDTPVACWETLKEIE